MSKVVAARFPEDLYGRLEEVARLRNRRKAEIIREALELYLQDGADYQIALDRLRDPSDAVVTAGDIYAELGWTGRAGS
jgi:RHH-type rel operon transcriptional repressor/antitoxin RelB